MDALSIVLPSDERRGGMPWVPYGRQTSVSAGHTEHAMPSIRAGAGRTEHRMSGDLNQCELPECLISLAISLGGVAG